ncbi:MAG: thymidylate kinase [Candidatus Bathyarchaeales archaeon]
MSRLVFIVIDGLDASGKSTQAVMLRNFLESSKKSVFLRIHPSNDNFFGAKARQFLYQHGKGAHLASAVFYMLDVIRSIMRYSWQKYDYIIFVRYLMGTAYLPSPIHKIAYHFFALWVPKSNFMFFLDVSPQEAYKRILQSRKRREMFESLEKLGKIRQKALALAFVGNWKILDADKPVEHVHKEILETLKSEGSFEYS